MPFGIIGRTGPGMRQAVGFGDRYMRRGTFGGEFGRAIVTSGDFTAYVCDGTATRPSSQITLGKFVTYTAGCCGVGRLCLWCWRTTLAVRYAAYSSVCRQPVEKSVAVDL